MLYTQDICVCARATLFSLQLLTCYLERDKNTTYFMPACSLYKVLQSTAVLRRGTEKLQEFQTLGFLNGNFTIGVSGSRLTLMSKIVT